MNTITYKDKEYPVRTFKMKSEDTGEVTYDISVASLEKEFWKDFGDPAYWDAEAESIDSTIYFYVDDAVVNLPAKTICEKHLDIPFKFIAEY